MNTELMNLLSTCAVWGAISFVVFGYVYLIVVGFLVSHGLIEYRNVNDNHINFLATQNKVYVKRDDTNTLIGGRNTTIGRMKRNDYL